MSDSFDQTAGQFVRARMHATALPAYPGAIPQDLASAYACQEAEINRWPDILAGWKVARIAPTWAGQYPEERLIGPVFRSNVHVIAAGHAAVCPIFDGGFAAVEAEIGIYIGADAQPGKADWTAATAATLVAQMHIGVEIASSPLATLNDLGPGAVISDFGNNWGVIVGAVIPDWRTQSYDLAVETFIDERSVGRAKVPIPQAPLSSLAFALNKAAQRGRPLRSGQYISTGAITGVHDIRIGEQSRIDYGQYGKILCRAVRAQPHPAAKDM